MSNHEWTCPHCDRVQTAGIANFDEAYRHLSIGKPAEGPIGCTTLTSRCLNSECRKASMHIFVHEDVLTQYETKPNLDKIIFAERLIPRGNSKPQPDYIPAPIREDYAEACLIRDLSPKAAATLARRCLQGMIRDFAKITRGTLDAEIRALTAAIEDGSAPRSISVESVEAIDHVRKIGNIGAHMERDINVVIDVDPGEAQALIELVELLLREWYVDRHNRQARLAAVAAIRAEKDQAKLNQSSNAAV